MKQLRIKKEPEIIYLPHSKPPQSCTFEWVALIIVCCMSTATIILNLLTLLS